MGDCRESKSLGLLFRCGRMACDESQLGAYPRPLGLFKNCRWCGPGPAHRSMRSLGRLNRGAWPVTPLRSSSQRLSAGAAVSGSDILRFHAPCQRRRKNKIHAPHFGAKDGIPRLPHMVAMRQNKLPQGMRDSVEGRAPATVHVA